MELKIARSGDETLSLLTGEETGSGNDIRQRRMSTSERTDSGFFSSGLCYLLSGLETNLSVESTRRGSARSRPRKWMIPGHLLFPVKSGIYHVRKATCFRTGWNPLRLARCATTNPVTR